MRRILRSFVSARRLPRQHNSPKPSHHVGLRRRLFATLLEDRSVPAVFTVTNTLDGPVAAAGALPGSLRQAIFDANALGGADIINFDATLAGQVVLLSAGELTITDDVTINGPTLIGPGKPNVTIDAGLVSRHFNLNMNTAASNTVTFNGLSMVQGSVAASGGSVLLNSPEDTFNFNDCVWDSNTGGNYGGAIGAAEPAIAQYGTININRGTFTNNKNTLNFGGALSFNMLLSGAGITKGWTATVNDTTFDNNQNDRNGGAVFIRGYACNIQFNRSTFSNNKLVSDGFGGTISVLSGAGAQSSTIGFTNCTISGNANNDTVPGPPVGNGGSGGVFGNGGGATPNITFRNSTIFQNAAAFSGGFFAASSGTPTVTLESSIVYGNQAFGLGSNSTFEGGIVIAKNSIIETKAGAAAFTDLGGNQFGAAADPLLGPLGTTLGGLTAYHVPGTGSPARENGFAAPAVTVDQRNGPRLLGSKVDVGSIESQDPAPIASALATNVLTPSVSPYQFTVTYSDDVAILASTIGTGDVTVSGPGGFTATPTLVGTPPVANGTPITVTYEFTPPVNGAAGWDFSDNGIYTISMAANQVSDAVPNFVKAGALTTFTVGIPQVFIVNALGDAGVGSGNKGDLRYCITQANLAVGAIDSITFDATLFSTPQVITLAGTELGITEGVVIAGPGAGKVTINGGGASRVFNVTGPASYEVIVSDVTVSGGNAATDGGAFLVSDEILSLNNVVVSGNTAGVDGGAIVVTSSGGKLFATNSKFLNNVANTSGGAIATNANALVTLTGCVLEGNSALINGGAIDLNLGNLIVNSSLLAGNSAAGKGGAISLTQVLGTLSISNSTLSGNSSNASGGAISTDHAGGTLTISNSTIADNFTAGTGGGLFHSGTNAQPGNTVVVSSIIYGNVSTSADVEVSAVQFKYSNSAIGGTIGGGVFVDAGGNLPLGTNPLIGPLANNGGASRTHGLLGASPAIDTGANPDALAFDQRGTGFPRVLNGTADMGAFEGTLPVPGGILTPVPTIIAAGPTPNTVTVTYVDETGINVGSIDVNDIEIIAPDLVTKLTITGVTTSGSGKSVAATYTFAVPVNGKAGWDTSDNGVYTVNLKAGQVFDTDVPTPNANFFQPLGNFNVQVPIIYTVDLVSDVDDGNTSVGQLTLREAIGLANADSQPSLIQFSPAAFSSAKTIVTAAGEMFITSAVKIVGPTAKLTLDAAGVGRIFNIDDTVNAGALVDISNLAISNGNVVGVNGGGIIIGGDDNLTLTNVLLSGNTTDTDGGGVFAAGKSTITVINSVISNNVATSTASQGGGFRIGQGGTLDIQNSTVSGNTAGANGGGWYFYDGGSLQVTNSSVIGNKSNTATGGLGGGGGYFFGAASGKGIVISGSTFSGNSSGTGLGGGGLMIQAGSGGLTVQNSTFSGNTANTGAGGGYGGAILANGGFGGTAVFSNNTFAFNDAGKSGGGFAWTGAAVTMNSNIIAKNTVGGVGTGAGADLFSLVTVVSGSNNLIGINDASTKVSFTGTNPLIGSVATPIDPQLGALANNGGPTFTHALLAGSPALNAGNNTAGLAFDQRGSGFNRTVGGGADIGAYEEQVVATPAKVTGVVINGGAAQRSRVTSLKVTFDQPVSFSNIANAFTLTRVSDSASVTLNTVLDGSGTFVTITFTGGAVDGANPVRSLADGRYTLTAVASQFAGSGLDGDGNGTGGDNFVFGSTPFVNVSTPATGVFRLFGDANGNGQVGTDDFLAFRLAFLSATDAFDNDGNGTVDAGDFLKFRLNFLATIV